MIAAFKKKLMFQRMGHHCCAAFYLIFLCRHLSFLLFSSSHDLIQLLFLPTKPDQAVCISRPEWGVPTYFGSAHPQFNSDDASLPRQGLQEGN